MPATPLEYMARYKPIQFSGCGSQGQKSISINKYVSGDVMKANQFLKSAYLDVKSFIFHTGVYQGGKRGAAAHTYVEGIDYLIASDLKPVPFHHCPWDDVRQAFQGKGTPTRKGRALKLLDYYLQHAEIVPGNLGWGKRVTDLQEYADYYIGMDCNGFVGAYLEENCPGCEQTNNIDIDAFGRFYGKKAKGDKFLRIDDPNFIQTGDVLIRSDLKDSGRHVSLVNSVLSRSSDRATLVLAESTGGSGLGMNTATLVKIATTDEGRNWKLGTKQTLYDAVIRSK